MRRRVALLLATMIGAATCLVVLSGRAPVVSGGWDAVQKEAKEAKIPVVLLDRDIDPSGKELYLTAVTSDSVCGSTTSASRGERFTVEAYRGK